MKIEIVDINSLIPDPSNARMHGDKNIAAIKGSLAKFQQRKPIVTRNGVVIAGNGTLAAAKQLGWTEIATVRADDMTATEAAAFAIADNRTSELAEWNMDVLGSTLHGLREDGFDLNDIGFDVSDLDKLLNEDSETLPNVDDTPTEFLIVVECENETDQKQYYEEFLERGVKCKIMS